MGTKKNKKTSNNIYQKRTRKNPYAPANAEVHVYGKNTHKCVTDSKGFPSPRNKNPAEIVLDASEGFIPLWKKGLTLRWRFSPSLYNFFQYPDKAMNGIRVLLAEALLEWGYAVPVKFSEQDDNWDFEIVVKNDDCNGGGCILASAFFPDSGRHQLVIYPKLFTQSPQEQMETMAHELGHIFGLRHFFAELLETDYPSIKFGKDQATSIMNYGDKSKMTESDRADLKELYERVWSGELKEINGTKIVTFWPYHKFGEMAECNSSTPFIYRH